MLLKISGRINGKLSECIVCIAAGLTRAAARPVLDRIIAYIDENIYLPLTIPEICEHFSLSRAALQLMFTPAPRFTSSYRIIQQHSMRLHLNFIYSMKLRNYILIITLKSFLCKKAKKETGILEFNSPVYNIPLGKYELGNEKVMLYGGKQKIASNIFFSLRERGSVLYFFRFCG